MNKKFVPAVYFQKNEDHTYMRRLFYLGGPETGRRKRTLPCFFLDMTWQLCIAGPQEGLKIRGGGHNLSPLVEIAQWDFHIGQPKTK